MLTTTIRIRSICQRRSIPLEGATNAHAGSDYLDMPIMEGMRTSFISRVESIPPS